MLLPGGVCGVKAGHVARRAVEQLAEALPRGRVERELRAVSERAISGGLRGRGDELADRDTLCGGRLANLLIDVRVDPQVHSRCPHSDRHSTSDARRCVAARGTSVGDGTDYLHQNFGGNAIPPSIYGGPPPLSTGYTPVTVTAGAITTGIDVRLQSGGAITGTVTDQQGHRLAGISVNLAAPRLRPGPAGKRRRVKTDATGRFRIGRLLTGTYRVSFAGAGFAGQLYPGVQTYDAARPIDVAAGGTVSGIDAQMDLAGSISGSVVDPAGHRVNAFVDAYRPDGTIASLAGSSSGGFTISDLAAGSYFVYATALDAPLYGFYTDPLGARRSRTRRLRRNHPRHRHPLPPGGAGCARRPGARVQHPREPLRRHPHRLTKRHDRRVPALHRAGGPVPAPPRSQSPLPLRPRHDGPDPPARRSATPDSTSRRALPHTSDAVG